MLFFSFLFPRLARSLGPRCWSWALSYFSYFYFFPAPPPSQVPVSQSALNLEFLYLFADSLMAAVASRDQTWSNLEFLYLFATPFPHGAVLAMGTLPFPGISLFIYQSIPWPSQVPMGQSVLNLGFLYLFAGFLMAAVASRDRTWSNL